MKNPILLVLVALSSYSGAQTLTQLRTFGPNIPPFGTVMTFNSYAGDLSDVVGVEIAWTMDIADGFLIIDNDAVDPATGTYEFGAQIIQDGATTDVTLLDGAFAPIFSATRVTNSGSFSLAGNVGDGLNDFDSAGPDGVAIAGAPAAGSGSGMVNNLFVSQYVSGAGGTAGSTFDIGIQTEQYLNVLSNDGTEYGITPVNASGTVTLIFHLVPEPETSLLGIVGGVMLLCRRRRF